MPQDIDIAIQFLETQWSSINQNKIKGIEAELRLEAYLGTQAIRQHYDHIIPGGWILAPGKNEIIGPPTSGRIALLPIPTEFSWTNGLASEAFSAQVLAHSYFRTVGITTYFTKFETGQDQQVEAGFGIPESGNYPLPYNLEFYEVSANGLVLVQLAEVTSNFPERNGLRGMRAYQLNRIDRGAALWQNDVLVTKLFWKEYTRYFLHRQHLVSSNDLDFFIVCNSGRAYPIEFKSKQVYEDDSIGDWFGIDIGPFSKLAFFVSLSNNMEALYIVEEVDSNSNTIEWWGVKFSEVLKHCYWVSQRGGTGMRGAASNTVKVPKEIFDKLSQLLPTL